MPRFRFIRMGMFSRVWSVPGQVGSLPWSAVTISRSSGPEFFEKFRQAGGRTPRARGRSHRRRGGARRARRSRRSWSSPGCDPGRDRAPLSVASQRAGWPLARTLFADAGVRVDVGDFADADDRCRLRCREVFAEPWATGERDGVVVAVAGALEIGARIADERPGDDAADGQVAGVENAAGGLAEIDRDARGRRFFRGRRSAARCRRRCRKSACRCACVASPSRAMMSVPEAWQLPRLPSNCRCCRAMASREVRRGKQSGRLGK